MSKLIIRFVFLIFSSTCLFSSVSAQDQKMIIEWKYQPRRTYYKTVSEISSVVKNYPDHKDNPLYAIEKKMKTDEMKEAAHEMESAPISSTDSLETKVICKTGERKNGILSMQIEILKASINSRKYLYD